MNIYVGNLSLEVSAEELRLVFLNFGQVISVSVVSDKSIGSGQGRGCAYLEMPVEAEADLAIEKLKGKSLKGRQIEVIKSLPITRDSRIQPAKGIGLSAFYRKIGPRGGRS